VSRSITSEACQAVELLIVLTSRSSGIFTHALHEARRPLDQVADAVRLQRVLILRASETRAHVDVLDGLEEQGGAGMASSLGLRRSITRSALIFRWLRALAGRKSGRCICRCHRP